MDEIQKLQEQLKKSLGLNKKAQRKMSQGFKNELLKNFAQHALQEAYLIRFTFSIKTFITEETMYRFRDKWYKIKLAGEISNKDRVIYINPDASEVTRTYSSYVDGDEWVEDDYPDDEIEDEDDLIEADSWQPKQKVYKRPNPIKKKY